VLQYIVASRYQHSFFCYLLLGEKTGFLLSDATKNRLMKEKLKKMQKSALNHPKTLPKRHELRLTENAQLVLGRRYLQKDADGEAIEIPEELFERVAAHIAGVEGLYGRNKQQVKYFQRCFYNLMASLRFLPNSPTLMNAGRSMGMLSACFVLPIPDSIDGIFDAVKHTALIQKAGGGTGFAFDNLRPTGDYITSSGGKTSGPISFWKVLSETTNAIQQGAFRRGANMGMMSLTHPDILKFLHAKEDLNAFNNYNISVKATDSWMAQLIENPDSPHVVCNPRTGKCYYLGRALEIWQYEINDLFEIPSDQDEDSFAPDIDAKSFWTKGQIWNLIVAHAHRTGEPGLAFIDRINRDNPTPQLGLIEATNPCGEQPLLSYEACNLGSINLAKFVRSAQTEQGCLIAAACEIDALRRIDFADLAETVHLAVRFLDNVIDVNNYQIEPIDKMCKANRKIGLGVMGFADLLYKLAVPYDSETALDIGRELMRFINDQAHQADEVLADERGVFPNWKGSIWESQFHRPQRNATVTTVAPTGTLSIIADCSGGIEPLFALAFTRNVLSGAQLLEVNEVFKRLAQDRGFYSEELIEQIAQNSSIAEFEQIPPDVKRVFVCAHDISPEWHVRMQGAFQEHCDASISKTINFPHEATIEQVDQIYRLAYELKCKGITVYRDGCRQNQPMTSNHNNSHQRTSENSKPNIAPGQCYGLGKIPVKPVTLPEIMTCVRVRQLTPFGNMHVKITVDPHTERELEVFAQLGKGGDLANSDLEAICRLLSLLLRCGGSVDLAIKQLNGIGSSLTIPAREGKIMSLGDGLAKAMIKYLRAKEEFGLKSLILGQTNLPTDQKGAIMDNRSGNHVKKRGRVLDVGQAYSFAAYKIKCPACDGSLSFEEGCVKCHSCGFSQC